MAKNKLISLLFFFAMGLNPAYALSVNPFIEGSFNDIKHQYKNKPFVLIFWSESCGYCMKELAMFGKLQKQFPNIALITVATDSFLEEETVTQVMERSGLDLDDTWVFAEQFPEMLYAEIYKGWRGELPVTHFFSLQNTEKRHLGIVEETWLTQWLTEQSLEQ